MPKFNTGNPVGSSDPRDLSDSAQVADELINGGNSAYPDRLGASRKSWAGVEAQAAQQQTTFDNFLVNSGYEFLGDYAAGIEVTQYNQVIRDTSGEFWRAAASTVLPYTTDGLGMPEGGAFVAVGDAALRQDMSEGRVTFSGQWDLVGRPQSPTPTVAGAGVLNGTYYWTVAYKTVNGTTEVSNSATASPAGNAVDVTLPVSADARVISRLLYRTKVGGIEPQQGYLVAEISDNTTTLYTDNISDGSLGQPAPHMDTSNGRIMNGSEVIGAVSSLSVAFGRSAMPTGQGYACTAIGGQALENNAGGYRNTAVGTNSLDGNTTGFNNTGVGVHALNDNQTGSNNAAVGTNAGFKITGSSQTTVGANALAEQVGGQRNTAVGTSAGQLRTSGDDNTLVGAESGFSAGSGSGNTAAGRRALYDLTTGNFNSTFGYFAGQDITTGSTNTAFGGRSLFSLQTGGGNVAVGWNAGYYETGSNHLWIDNAPRTDLADAKTKALVYGEFGVDRAGQKVDFNGQVNPLAGLGMPGRTVTADGSVAVDDTVLSCNKSGTLTLTLPTGKLDKVLILRNLTANAVVSASANVQPIGGGADTTSILPGTAGAWAVIRCRASGTAWEIVMSG